jgi:hypothetical protein
MIKLLLIVGLIAAAGVCWIGLNQPALGVVPLIPAGYFYVQEMRKQSRERIAIGAETTTTDAELRKEVIETQILAFTHLTDADDLLKGTVAAIIADAAKHLGSPYMGGQRIYSAGYTLSWNKDGLSKIAQARQLVDDYIASIKPAA